MSTDATIEQDPPGLRVVDSGASAGIRVVLVHGAMDRSAGMARLARLAGERGPVRRYDRRGYGESGDHAGPFDIEGNIEDLLGLLDERPAVVFGHSYGGNIALAAAHRRPDLVRGVAVYEAPMSWEPWWSGNSRGLREDADPVTVAEGFMISMIGETMWQSLPEATRAERRREGRALVAELIDLARRCPYEPSEISIPVRVGYGTRSREHHRRAAIELASRLPRGVAVELDADHGAHRSASAQVWAQLLEPVLGNATSTS